MKKNQLLLTLLLALTAMTTQAQLTNGLKAYYPFGGNSADLSGQSNHGIVEGTVTLTADRFGTANCAYAFPGDGSSYIYINNSPDFNIPVTGTFSISLWFQGGTPDAGDLETLFQKSVPGSVTDIEFFVGLFDLNKPLFGTGGYDVWSNITIWPTPDPAWHHVVGVYDNKRWYIYEDNVLKETDLTQTHGIAGTNGNVYIGEWFQGKIDDVRFYNRVLTVAEIDQLFHLPGSCESVLEVPEVSATADFTVYPNPTKNILHVTTSASAETHVIYLFDITGRAVMRVESNTPDTLIDISNLNEGTYLVKTTIEGVVQTKLILKKD